MDPYVQPSFCLSRAVARYSPSNCRRLVKNCWNSFGIVGRGPAPPWQRPTPPSWHRCHRVHGQMSSGACDDGADAPISRGFFFEPSMVSQEAAEFFAAVWPDLPAHHRAEVAAWLQTMLAARSEAVCRALTCFAQAGALEAATHRWEQLANGANVLELVLHWGAVALDDEVGCRNRSLWALLPLLGMLTQRQCGARAVGIGHRRCNGSCLRPMLRLHWTPRCMPCARGQLSCRSLWRAWHTRRRRCNWRCVDCWSVS